MERCHKLATIDTCHIRFLACLNYEFGARFVLALGGTWVSV